MRVGGKGDKSFFCPECEAGFKNKSNMKVHYKTVHEGFKYPCDQCDHQASQPANLKRHIEAKHLGIKRKQRPIQTGK